MAVSVAENIYMSNKDWLVLQKERGLPRWQRDALPLSYARLFQSKSLKTFTANVNTLQL